MSASSAGSTSGLVSTSASARDRDPLLRRLPEDRANPRVRVLHVVDGVVARLPRRHGQIELERAVVPARQEREAGGVAADLLEQLLHQHELAAPLGHAHGLAVAQQGHQLHDQDLECLGRMAERLHRGAHARHVAVVIGTEQVDDAIGAGELHVVVIGDVDTRSTSRSPLDRRSTRSLSSPTSSCSDERNQSAPSCS